MEGLTINEAADTTGWSPRMLRYLESVGLIEPPRNGAGYRIYGPGELQRLRCGELVAERHQARHLVLGERDLLAAEAGERQVGDLEVRGRGGRGGGLHEAS